MKYTNEQKVELRTSLKKIGYGCKIQEKQSPFSDKIVTFISFVLPDKSAPMIGANVFPAEFRNKHAAAFDIVNNFVGKYKA
jgi:hypothetical protein